MGVTPVHRGHGSAGSDVTLEQGDGHWIGRFQAMASPCEVLMEVSDALQANRLALLAWQEARRIEAKFSRYREGNIIHRINTSAGHAVEVDDETANLLDYADQCHALSDGRFDITSGVLRAVWSFDGSDRLPEQAAVADVLERVGWHKVTWRRPWLTLPAGMQIDLGGIGKEYAVDSVARLLQAETDTSVLINFGGDLFASGPRAGGRPWRVGVDDPAASGHGSLGQVELRRGGLATSGDARRFLLKDGIRYSHILDPRTGWPVTAAPRAVTVAAPTCTEAGMLATFAMLHGAAARAFLEDQGVPYWCVGGR